jgi:hypothetical protein
MGDSYSAGVGAGSRFVNPLDPSKKCFTTTGSYPMYLQNGNRVLREGLKFISCTGDVIANVNDAAVGSQGRGSQLELLQTFSQGSYKFGTLSIGGNDLGFADIVTACIVYPFGGGCDEALRKAESLAGVNPRDSAAHIELSQKLKRVYRDIIDTAGDDFTLVVTGYARFFAEPSGNPDCNEGQLEVLALKDIDGDTPIKPNKPLTETLRTRINRGIVMFNGMLSGAVFEVQQALLEEGSRKRIKFFDTDPIYEGYRFCEPLGRDEPGWPEFTDRAWFFSSALRYDILPDNTKLAPRGDVDGPKLELDRRGTDSCSDPYYKWDCIIGDLMARDPNALLNEKEYGRRTIGEFFGALGPVQATKSAVMQTFHPKSIAYKKIARGIAATFGQ